MNENEKKQTSEKKNVEKNCKMLIVYVVNAQMIQIIQENTAGPQPGLNSKAGWLKLWGGAYFFVEIRQFY